MKRANDDRTHREQQFVGTSLALGVGVGTALGVALHNIAIGVALGVAIGLCLGVIRSRRAGDGRHGGDR